MFLTDIFFTKESREFEISKPRIERHSIRISLSLFLSLLSFSLATKRKNIYDFARCNRHTRDPCSSNEIL